MTKICIKITTISTSQSPDAHAFLFPSFISNRIVHPRSNIFIILVEIELSIIFFALFFFLCSVHRALVVKHADTFGISIEFDLKLSFEDVFHLFVHYLLLKSLFRNHIQLSVCRYTLHSCLVILISCAFIITKHRTRSYIFQFGCCYATSSVL